jgi:CheY-like chemotaxis protein
MNGVLGMIELALGRASDGRQIDWLGKARRSGQHLLVVINDILDVTKLDAGRVSLARVDFRLDRLLEESTDLLAPVLAGKGLSFELDLPADLGRQTLRGDATRLQQIVLNLAGNAVKFTPRGGVIVRLREQEASATDVLLRVEVQDSGIGVAAPDQSRLFQAFEQVDPSSTRAFGGTGLGLAICARLVRLMGGEIGVASQAGVGSTFWFTARLEHSAAPNGPLPLARGSGAGERLRAGHAGARVLIAEDEPTNQELLCAMLEAVGLQLDVAGDGAAAVAMARATPYALILMDLQMPQLDGFAAARSIRALPERAHTPIVALTASAFDQDRQRCIEAGMDDHLGKPASAEQLYETLLKWLPRPAA